MAKSTESHKLAMKRWQDKNRRIYSEWKLLQSCLVCAESESCVLDLHHLDPSEKEFQIGALAPNMPWKKLEIEISKCVILCSNCHRKLHAGVISLPEIK